MAKIFRIWSMQRRPWLILALSAIVFELVALYFQYGKNLQPCVMCIYERTAMLGIVLSALLAFIAPRWLLLRFIATVGFIASSSWGLLLAWQHMQLQLHPSPFTTCSPYPHFPNWLKLNDWFPWMFQPHGDCSLVVWKLMNWSMPQWLMVAFGVYLIMALLILAGQFRR
ncbi:disulfide bond formation protein DsbB [Celerinatantimonas diazotrophica]|uniref:Disulfide bond formation protein B n=1 Tax=Celerinatantimonas diazotrophica TaxID=412034 RepID=A0A4R1JAU0_9GAMM|nr:disulfide bond formation protein DsbB [Celerinatantimonas diazotrophica]TCK47624.1 thiol:disulfide interchange protein DsbB [Celerinatantimonas diazotrophica]CAG9296753.1 Disulfide bond formation protein B [Celerinatantimonas diazotrophica]